MILRIFELPVKEIQVFSRKLGYGYRTRDQKKQIKHFCF